MLKLLKVGAIGALAVAVLVWPAAWAVGSQAETLQAIEPGDAETVKTNQQLYELDPTGEVNEITRIYGAPLGAPTAYVFFDASRVLHPVEKPDLRLLQVYKSRDENPLQLQSVHLFARFASFGAGAAGLLMLGLLAYLRRRRERAPAAAQSPPAAG